MNQFVQRIANYVANEIVIKGLANSKTFQRFAVRTDAQLRSIKNQGEEGLNSKLDELHKAANKAAFSEQNSFHNATGARAAGSSSGGYHTSGPPVPPKQGFGGFVEALGKVIGKDLGIGK
jgi:hypothetical protein